MYNTNVKKKAKEFDDGEIFSNLQIDGNLKQIAYEGKNKFNSLFRRSVNEKYTHNGITYIFNSDGSIKINGTASALSFCLIYGESLNLYTTSLFKLPNTFKVSGMIPNTNFMGRLTNGNYIRINEANGGMEFGVLYIEVPAGITVNGTAYLQIEEGTNITSYEPYVGGVKSPNSNYPQKIDTVKTYNLVEKFTFSSNPTQYSTALWANCELKPNTTYTISYKGAIGNKLYCNETLFTQVNTTVVDGVNTMTLVTKNEISKENPAQYDKTNDLGWRIFKNDTGNTVIPEFNDVMIAEGTENKPYLSYGNIRIEQKGGNLVKKFTFSSNPNQYLVVLWANCELKPNTTYTISYKGAIGNKLYCNETLFTQVITTVVDGVNTMTLVTKNDISKENTAQYEKTNNLGWKIFKNYTGNTVTPKFNDVMIVEGTKIYPYEPWRENEYNIDLKGNELCKIGNVKDNLIINEKGLVFIEKHIGKIVLNGSENWSNFTNLTDVARVTLNKTGVNSNIKQLSSHFIYNTSYTGNNEHFYIYNNMIYVFIKQNTVNKLTDFKSWLSKNPVTIYYVLETPEIIELDNISIKLYEGKNNFKLFTNLETNFDIEYYEKITEEFKDRVLKGKIVRAYMKVLKTETEEEFIINESNYLKDFIFEDLRYVPNKGIIGGAVARRVTGNFNNIDNNFNIENREFELYIGVELEDKSIDYIKYGTFIVQKPEDNTVNDNTQFEALDYMIKANKIYEDRIVYPCTLKDLFYDVVDQCGLNTSVSDFTNSNFIIENNQFEEGTTNREVLQAIAEVSFNWVRIDEYDNVVMDFEIKDNINQIITIDEYKEFNKSEKFGPINVVVFKNSQIEGENITYRDENSILKYGETELVIEDNPFAYTQDKRIELIENAKNIIGLEYYPVKIESIGFIYLNCKDKIEIEDLLGNKYNTYLFNHIITYNGVVMDSIESLAQTKNETKYQFISDMINKMEKTEIMVDKANKQIDLVVGEQENQTLKITEITENLEGVKTTVDQINNLTKEVEGNTKIKLEDCKEGNLLELHIYGNNTVFNYKLYPNQTVFPNNDLYMEGTSIVKLYTNTLLPSNNLYPNTNLYLEYGHEEEIILGIPFVLRQLNDKIFDEYVYTYKDKKSYIIRRVGKNTDGTLYSLLKEKIEELPFVEIKLKEGINYLSLTEKNNAKIKVKYATRTSLTDVFAEVIELKNNVTVTQDSYSINISREIDGTKKESYYRQTPEKITLKADEIELMGNINLVNGKILYNNSSGNSGTIKLLESCANYTMIEVFGFTNNNVYGSAKIYNPNRKTQNLLIGTDETGTSINLNRKLYTFLDDTITIIAFGCYKIGATQAGNNIQNNIYITQVIGYK